MLVVRKWNDERGRDVWEGAEEVVGSSIRIKEAP